MKVEKLPEYVTSVVVITLGLIFALYCGTLTGEGQIKIIGSLLGGAAFLTLCMGMQTRTWLLIPLTWGLGGSLPFLPVPITVRQIGVVTAVASYLVLYALKGLRGKPEQDLVRLLIFLNLAYLFSVFVRNPVGLHMFGSEMVGGRPYLNVAIAFMAFWVLERVPVVQTDLRRLPIVLLIGPVLLSIASFITYLEPSIRSYLGRVYSDFAEADYGAENANNDDQVKRKVGLSAGGNAAIRTLCSYFAPLTLILPMFPFRFAATAAAFTALLLSGFRSGLFTAIVFMLMATYFRKRYRDLLVFALLGTFALAAMAMGNGRLFTIPLAAQRALSFLPGNWDYAAVQDAKYSSEWRFQMWRIVMTEDKWIKNKWLGDGFGFSQRDLAIMAQEQQSASGLAQESFMIVGAYHNGPLSTVRYVGFVGMLLFVPLLLLLAWRGVKLIRLTYGTKLFPVALFVGMPVIITPPVYFFMVGGFEENLPEALFAAGLLQLLGRAVTKTEEVSPSSEEKAVLDRAQWKPRENRQLLPR